MTPLSRCSHARPDPSPHPTAGACACAAGVAARATVSFCATCPRFDGDAEARAATVAAVVKPVQITITRHYTPAQLDLMARRRAVCKGCDQSRGFGTVTVQCHACGCAGLSLFSGECKAGKWPAKP